MLSKRNLAPAELPKQAASFDLPITLGILAGSGQVESDRFEQYAVVGELALDGSTRPARGALSMAIAAAEQEGVIGLVVPSSSAAEAAVVEGIEVIPVASLAQAVGFFTGEIDIEPTPSRLDDLFRELSAYDIDFSDAALVLYDDLAVTVPDVGADEERFATIGTDALGRLVVVVYSWRDQRIRIISARRATGRERRRYEG